MPLLDHFRPPLSDSRHWESFYAFWATFIGELLNEEVLPDGYFAEAQVHVGSRVEVDVAAFEGPGRPPDERGGVAVASRAWAVTAATWTIPTEFPDSLEVLVYRGESGPTLVAAVELVSPANKDRPESRVAFAAKCASYLQQGVGLATVDIVTSRRANLHNELIAVLGCGGEFLLPDDGSLRGVSYRPARRAEGDAIDVWPMTLALDEPLPTLPLSIGSALIIPLDLERTYSRACRAGRLNRP